MKIVKGVLLGLLVVFLYVLFIWACWSMGKFDRDRSPNISRVGFDGTSHINDRESYLTENVAVVKEGNVVLCRNKHGFLKVFFTTKSLPSTKYFKVICCDGYTYRMSDSVEFLPSDSF